MAKKIKNEDRFEQVERVFDKTERYIMENKKSLMIIIGSVVLIVLGYVTYRFVYLPNKENSAQREFFRSQLYVEDASNKDSVAPANNDYKLALDGDGQSKGILEVADNYSMTKTGNLANYSAGVVYLQLGDYRKAIDYLSDFSSEDIILSSLAKGCIGDAYFELGEKDNAINAYNDAIENSSNNFTTPIYLIKLAVLYESNKNYKEALKIYKRIKKDFKDYKTMEVEQYIVRLANK